MPRSARQLSETGYLHIIVRGVGKQVLFEEPNDYSFYLSMLKQYAAETTITICAFCLMENHVHLLIKDICGNTPIFMKKIGVCYSGYFNRKYERSGHLFQGRYLSEPVENALYLRTVFRYILNNPQKAGICNASIYPWSSYSLYAKQESFIDNSVLQDMMIGNNEYFDDFLASEDSDPVRCMDFHYKITDSLARKQIQKLLNVESGTSLQSWDRKKRNQALRKLKDAGLSIRQIERLTGISRNIVQRA